MIKLSLALTAFLSLTTPAFAEDCAPVPPPVTDIALERFYEDSAGSIVEPARLEEHKAKTAPLFEFIGEVTKLADRAHQQRSSPTQTIACALTWLRGWAEGGAYLGKMDGKQAEAQRKWDLAGAALAYLKLKKWATDADRKAIEPWLIKVADASFAHFDDTSIKRNNHWYWMGLGLGAVGIAADSAAHWSQAKVIMGDAAKDISADGTLPLEMAREGRALYYHAFAVMPLVALAELGASRGEDWYALGDGALHRLVAKTAEGLNDPAIFDKLAGVPQQRPVKPGAGWVALYDARYIGRLRTRPEQPSKHRWLGGQVDVLGKVLEEK
ncbi:MAG: alginate lyase family protein, partial [Hyphomicrobium sp.]